MITTLEEDVVFICDQPKLFRVHLGIKLTELKPNIKGKLSCTNGYTVAALHYRCPISVVGQHIKYRACAVADDDDIDTMFSMLASNPQLTCIELYANLAASEPLHTTEMKPTASYGGDHQQSMNTDDPNVEIMNEIMEDKLHSHDDTPWYYGLYGSVNSEEWQQYNLWIKSNCYWSLFIATT
ncbi:hypothetical protein E2542_SST24391 [Spatholobus suberectus]|nr:hypothetical protein E2542_SST24391 [Spatholobus suberectus]